MDGETTNILLVDDLPQKLLAYRTILDDLGQNLVTAGSGAEALGLVLRHDFAVILLDVNMPGIDGFETAALIRRRRKSAHTPIIFLTAFADEVRAAEGYAHGAVDYISTPVVPAILRAKVKVFVDLYRMAQQVRRQADERIALAEERSKREAAEEANRRLGFLTRAGAVLGQSLDHDVTARDVARLPVPYLADLAAVVLPRPRGGGWRVVVARGGPDGPPDVADGTDRAALPPAVAAAVERALAGGPPGPAAGPVVAFPLQARGRRFAALALSREPTGRAFGPADVTVAEALASRAEVALDNARLYRDVERADRQKNEFLSMLAHELRNPLAPIRNAAEVLRLQAPDLPRVQWAREVIDRQLTHLVRLVDDLLDVSRITRGKIHLQREAVDLGKVVAVAVEASRPMLERAGHAFEVSVPADPVWVDGDPARLAQVFTNLLNNAAKYTEQGGRVWLSVRAAGGGGPAESPPGAPAGDGPESAFPPSALVSVKDTGIGIPADMLGSVFDLFTQLDRAIDRSQGGLGVGLTLVKRLVEMHGGTIEARSPGPGGGSEFVVRLPTRPPAPAGGAAAAGPHRPPAGRLRVLIVDDNVDAADSLGTVLGLAGHEPRVAHDGPAGLALAGEFDPHVVLLDIGLPGMDGFEVCRRLRAGAGRALVVALTGYGQDSDRQKSKDAGFDHHLVKPVDPPELMALLAAFDRARAGGG